MGALLTTLANADFNPRRLFISDAVKGAIYDYDDFAYLYQKADGSVPITALEQPVGLMLDKRYGGAVGDELRQTGVAGLTGSATAATFNTSTGAASVTRVDGTNQSYITFTATAPRWYALTISVATGNVQVRMGAFNAGVWSTITAGTTVTIRAPFLAGSVIALTTSSGTATFTVSSLRELPGLHAYQSTDAARPVLSARYNLLTYTQDVTPRAGSWNHSNVAAYSNQSDGVIRVQTAGSGTETILIAVSSASFAVGQSATARVQVRDVSYTGTLSIDLQEASSPFPSTTQNVTLSADWQTITIARTLTTAGVTTCYLRFRKASATVGGTFEFRFPDLRLTADANPRLPAYQRVTTATDYDSAGFPRFLRIDATDDFMQTAPVDPGTDKVFVCAGVTKVSDAAGAIVCEWSASTPLNAGSFYVAAPEDTSVRYSSSSRGSAASIAGQRAGISAVGAAVDTAVLSATHDIAGDSSTIARNGVAGTPSSVDKGTGNFGSYPLYIGARGGTGVRLNNGRIYPMVIAFKSVTAGEIAATEQWLRARCPANF